MFRSKALVGSSKCGRSLMRPKILLWIAAGLFFLRATHRVGAQDQSPPPGTNEPSNIVAADSKKSDIEALTGEWKVERLCYPVVGYGDIDAQEAEKRQIYWVFEGNKATAYRGGKVWGAPYRVVVDEKASPKRIDLIYTEGPVAGRGFLSIYSLEGDRLRMYMAQRVRPDKFLEMGSNEHGIDWLLVRKPKK